jgi:hypothetical protein
VSANSESTPPRGYVPIEMAANLLTQGGTPLALSWAVEFLRLVASTQGTTRDGVAPVPALGCWQGGRGEPLHLNMHDIPALREEFKWWNGGQVPAEECTEPVPTGVETKATASPRDREYGKDAAYEHLLELSYEYLLELMRSGPPAAGHDKGTVRKHLMSKYKITGRQFSAVWDRALDTAGARETWADPWDEVLSSVLGEPDEDNHLCGKIRICDVWKIIAVPIERRDQRANERLGIAVRRLGFERTRLRFGHRNPESCYVRGSDEALAYQIVIGDHGRVIKSGAIEPPLDESL